MKKEIVRFPYQGKAYSLFFFLYSEKFLGGGENLNSSKVCALYPYLIKNSSLAQAPSTTSWSPVPRWYRDFPIAVRLGKIGYLPSKICEKGTRAFFWLSASRMEASLRHGFGE